MKIIEGLFFKGDFVTVEIKGIKIKRKVKYNRLDGLYILFNNMMYFEYEFEQ